MLRRSKLVLGIAAVLFVAWIGYLAFLVFATSRPVILSRPQILDASAVVIARVDEVDGKPSGKVRVVAIDRVRLAEGPSHWQALAGEVITVENIAECRGWRGAGQYILPLEASVNGGYLVFDLTARSPGFDKRRGGGPFIYVSTEQTRRQLADIPQASLGGEP